VFFYSFIIKSKKTPNTHTLDATYYFFRRQSSIISLPYKPDSVLCGIYLTGSWPVLCTSRMNRTRLHAIGFTTGLTTRKAQKESPLREWLPPRCTFPHTEVWVVSVSVAHAFGWRTHLHRWDVTITNPSAVSCYRWDHVETFHPLLQESTARTKMIVWYENIVRLQVSLDVNTPIIFHIEKKTHFIILLVLFNWLAHTWWKHWWLLYCFSRGLSS